MPEFISGLSPCSIDLFVCFCVSIILSWLLRLCSIVWSQGSLIPPALFFFLKIALAIQDLLYFHTNCKNFWPSSVKNAIGNLGLYWIYRLLWVVGSFSRYWFFKSKNMHISPSVCAIFDFFHQYLIVFWASLVAQMVKNPPAVQETGVWSWVGKIPWRRAWQPTPVFLPGESPWTEESGGLQSMWLQRIRHDWATKHTHSFLSTGLLSH